jgi:hypothetical protein
MSRRFCSSVKLGARGGTQPRLERARGVSLRRRGIRAGCPSPYRPSIIGPASTLRTSGAVVTVTMGIVLPAAGYRLSWPIRKPWAPCGQPFRQAKRDRGQYNSSYQFNCRIIIKAEAASPRASHLGNTPMVEIANTIGRAVCVVFGAFADQCHSGQSVAHVGYLVAALILLIVGISTFLKRAD